MFASIRRAAALGRRIEKSRHFSEPAVFVAKVARKSEALEPRLTHSCRNLSRFL